MKFLLVEQYTQIRLDGIILNACENWVKSARRVWIHFLPGLLHFFSSFVHFWPKRNLICIISGYLINSCVLCSCEMKPIQWHIFCYVFVAGHKNCQPATPIPFNQAFHYFSFVGMRSAQTCICPTHSDP